MRKEDLFEDDSVQMLFVVGVISLPGQLLVFNGN